MEEEIKNIDKFKGYWGKESESYFGRKNRIIKYYKLAWYKGLSGLLAMSLFSLLVGLYESWSILIGIIGVVIYLAIYNAYLRNISKKSEKELNEFLNSYEGTEWLEDKEEISKDPFYSELNPKQLNNYQNYFSEIINSIDIGNLTFSRTHNFRFNKKKADRDLKLIDTISKQAQDKDGLSVVILKIMVEQYTWADAGEREKDKDKWAKRVVNRKELDYFPAANEVYKLLFGK